MIFADKLIMLRKQKGLSQEELANEIGVSRQSVSKWEGAQSVPDLAKMVKLSQFFDVSTDYLLKDELEEPEVKKPEPLPVTVEKPDTDDAIQMTIGEVTAYFKRTKLTTILKSAALTVLILCPAIVGVMQSRGVGELFSRVEDRDSLSLVMVSVLLLISLALLLTTYLMEKKYNSLKVQPVDPEYGGAGVAEDQLSKYGRIYRVMKISGIITIAAGAACLIFALIVAVVQNNTGFGLQNYEELCGGGLVAADVFFGGSVFLLTLSSARLSNIYCILEEGKFSRRNKKKNAGIRLFSLIYIGLYVLLTVISFFVNLTLGFVVAVAGLAAYAIIYAALVSSLIKQNKIGKDK